MSCLKEQVLIALVVSVIYAKVTSQNVAPGHYEQIILEVLDVSQRMINWKYREQNSLNDFHNKTIQFAIDMFLVLLEECIEFVEREQINVRLVEVVKRINQNEINLVPKIKSIYVISKHFDHQSIMLELNFASIFAEYRAFLISSYQGSVFNQSKNQNLEELTQYISKVYLIFNSLYNFRFKFATPQNEVQSEVQSLVNDYLQYLSDIRKYLAQVNLQLILAVQQYAENFKYILPGESADNFQNISIDKDFLEVASGGFGGGGGLSGSRSLGAQSPEPQDLVYIAFNLLSQGVVKSRLVFDQESTLCANPVSNLRHLTLRTERLRNIFECPETLVTGVSDFVQVYVSHSVFPYKSLVAVRVRLVNPSQFRLENLRVRLLHSESLSVQNSLVNARVQELREIAPLGEE